MSYLPVDQRELFLPLVEGVQENPPWGVFLRNLVAHTNARHAMLGITFSSAGPGQEPVVLHAPASRAAAEPAPDVHRITGLGLPPQGGLRPGRVYALDEMLDYGDAAQVACQRAALADMGVRFARCARVSVPGAADAWLLLIREKEDFAGGAIAALSAVLPHLAAALRTLVALIEQRLQASMAQSALQRIGVGQLAFDAGGRVIAVDPQAEQALVFAQEPDPSHGRRLQLLPEASRALEAACAGLAHGAPDAGVAVLLDDRRPLWLVLRKAALTVAGPRAGPAAIGTLRLPRREDARTAVRVIAAVHGLSAREAALAHALTLGETIVDAGRRLRLTPETARNYSKRIYAKTGATGQADLVRLILTGLTPFC